MDTLKKNDRETPVILELQNVSFSYDPEELPALQKVNLKIRRGKKVALMGANGSGKSTLFLCMNGIHRPDHGKILFHGKPVEYTKKGLLELRSKVGIVFQDPDSQLFSANVIQEISFGILNLGVEEVEAREEVRKVIERLGITPFQDRPTHALSGGQKKQVSIADILVMHPEVVILDEPAAALDPKHTKIVNDYVDQLAEEGITVLIATHDIEYACAWADEIVLMKDGTILRMGTPEEICADTDVLHRTNLEEPGALRLYRRWCARGILKEEKHPPLSIAELERLL